METIVVVVVVGCGPAWPRLLIPMDSTPFETPSNKLRLSG